MAAASERTAVSIYRLSVRIGNNADKFIQELKALFDKGFVFQTALSCFRLQIHKRKVYFAQLRPLFVRND